MKSYEFVTKIVDRDNESDEIKQDLQVTTHSKVRIIYAESAIGKSSLSKKILEKCHNDSRHIISVKTKPENITNSASDWLFIDKIFECINKYFTALHFPNNYSFERYLCDVKDKYLKKQIIEQIIEQTFQQINKFNPIKLFVYYQLVKLLKVKEFNSQNILESNTYSARMIKSRYIQYVLSNIDVLLVIDNIQNIDSASWKFFLDWLSMTKNRKHYIILEYTISNKYTFENMFRMLEEIGETGTQVTYSELEKLSPEYVIDIIDHHFPNKPQDLDFNISLLNHYKSNANGNLRQLVDYTINYVPENKQCKTPTTDNLIAMRKTSKYAFSILVYCNGEISLELFQNLFFEMQISLKETEETLTDLCSREIIDIQNKNIIIKHASLIDAWKRNNVQFDEYNNLAYAKLESYFLNVLHSCKNNTQKDYAWVILLQMYAAKNPYKIHTLLSEMQTKIITQISPTNTWKYLSQLINVTKEKVLQFKTIYFQILHICFQMELYSEGYFCLNIMEQKISILACNKLLLYKSMFLSALDKHEENINLYQSYLPLLGKKSNEYFNLKLIVLCSFRSLNKYDKCLELHHELYSQRKYMSDYVYSIFLRLINIYMPDDKAINFARKSMKKFHKLGNATQEAKSMITYAKLLSGLDHGHKAIKTILKAEKLLVGQYIGRHMIYCNQAAFLLMQGKTDDNIFFLLEQAECSAVVPYDQLGIIVNKLVWCYQNKRYDLLDLLIAKANRLIPYEPDEHVHVLIYYNLYLLFKQKGDLQTATKYYNLAYTKKSKCKFVEARFDNIQTKEMKYRLKYPWHICYLSFWTYDLDVD